jgi:hypothetical protein
MEHTHRYPASRHKGERLNWNVIPTFMGSTSNDTLSVVGNLTTVSLQTHMQTEFNWNA